MDTLKKNLLVSGLILAATAIGCVIYETTMNKSLDNFKANLDRQEKERREAYQRLLKTEQDRRANMQAVNDELDDALAKFYKRYPTLRPK